ncbi:MAG: hypothetical protein KBS97_01910 [Firmicutes bacterium]|nr:hypothetical protein [Candidatus Fiminaster equi]
MKTAKLVLFILGIFMLSIITFYAFNLIFTVVANHQALDIVSLSGLPMILFMITLIIILVAGWRYFKRKETDLYFARYYGVVVGALSLVGLGLSIFTGVGIYHTFVGPYVFNAYPLIMTIAFSLLILGSIGLVVYITKVIKEEKIEKTYKGTILYGLREAGLSILLVYALERLGAFVLIPVYYSSQDGAVTIPYLIQLLIPSFVFLTYIIHEYYGANRKRTFIFSCVAVGYSLFSLLYMIFMSKGNYPLTINSLSAIQQFERLVTYPISAIILYVVSIILPLLNGLNNGILLFKEKKAKKAE